jgi:hypothetical protein
MLQRQIDLFEEQKAQFNEQRNALLKKESTRERSQSPKYSLRSSTSKLQDGIIHKRSSSDDIQMWQGGGSPFEPLPPEHSHSLKEPLRDSRSNSRLQLGAITELQQQLPLKLAGSTSKPLSPPQTMDSRPPTTTHIFRPTPSHSISSPPLYLQQQQRLPLKLAVGSTRSTPNTQQLPLKLASDSTSKRPRSAGSSSSSAGGDRGRLVDKHSLLKTTETAQQQQPQRQEPEIIYF